VILGTGELCDKEIDFPRQILAVVEKSRWQNWIFRLARGRAVRLIPVGSGRGRSDPVGWTVFRLFAQPEHGLRHYSGERLLSARLFRSG